MEILTFLKARPGCIAIPFFFIAFLYMMAKARGDFWSLFFGDDDQSNAGIQMESQHLIRHKGTKYPMHVNDVELSSALKTGDYELVQAHEGGGYTYSGWIFNESNGGKGQMAENLYVPPGQRIVQRHEYNDQRLN